MLHKSLNKTPNIIERKIIGEKKNKNNIIDVSHFFLFESVDDSEGEVFHHHHHDDQYGDVMVMGFNDNDDDNDAESCSYDTWDNEASCSRGSRFSKANDNINVIVNNDDDDDDDDKLVDVMNVEYMRDNYDYDYDYVDDDHHHKKCTSEIVSTANSLHYNKSTKSCVDSSGGNNNNKKKISISENERNKLFWETCLAS